MSKTAGILIIGNEILSGKTVDSNSSYLCKELRNLGLEVCEIAIVPDEVDRIADLARNFSGRFDYVFTSGGVGPTHDDVTIEGIARAFGKRVVRHPALVEILKSWYEEDLNEARLKMAEVPEGSELQAFDKLSFPVVVFKNVFIFPGIPQILREKFEAIKEDFRDAPFFVKTIYVKTPEGKLASYMNRLLTEYPKLLVGSYPEMDNPAYYVKITVESKDIRYLEDAFQSFMSSLPPDSVVKVEHGPIQSHIESH